MESITSDIDRGQWQKALGHLEKLLAREPMNEEALVEISMIHLLDRKDPGAAIPYMKRALAINAGNGSMVSAPSSPMILAI